MSNLSAPANELTASVQAAVHEALHRGMRTSEGRGVSAGPIFLALWIVAIGTLLEAAEPADAVALLDHRANDIRGFGHNADSAVIRLPDDAVKRRAMEAAYAAEIIHNSLEEFAVDPGDEWDPAPQVLLDSALGVLREAWGPLHLRRAIAGQIEAIGAGADRAILPDEPSTLNSAILRRSSKVEPERFARAARKAELSLSFAPYRGQVVWVAVIALSNAGRRTAEVREIAGISNSDDMKLGEIDGCLEAVRSLGVGNKSDEVLLRTESGFLATALELSLAGNVPEMPGDEAKAWSEIIETLTRWQSRIIHRGTGAPRPIDEKANRILRRRLADLAQSGTEATVPA
ncbi:hypothetical protein OCUBac02_50970 (plasmid) [Bosea sp. ANAM02]|nr:hypothetical protein OCUBac02_50970 [Bosea sp. ANAM02]